MNKSCAFGTLVHDAPVYDPDAFTDPPGIMLITLAHVLFAPRGPLHTQRMRRARGGTSLALDPRSPQTFVTQIECQGGYGC
jgi:hypothetical protein